jgi:hypothetical protein
LRIQSVARSAPKAKVGPEGQGEGFSAAAGRLGAFAQAAARAAMPAVMPVATARHALIQSTTRVPPLAVRFAKSAARRSVIGPMAPLPICARPPA